MTAQIILGVSVGTRTIGLAVLKGGTVLDWQIKSFKKGWSERKLEVIIESIDKVIVYHQVTTVAVKTPCDLSSGSNMIILLRRFEKAITERGIEICKYTLSELKRSCRIDLANKREVMLHAAELYPCMERLSKKELQNRNPYHLKVFEALLSAHCYAQS